MTTTRNEQYLPMTQPPFSELQQMAAAVAKSGLFNCRTPEQALTLMMLSQAEGVHPIQAMRMYHIIEGKPSMRADAMQAKFQARGGKIVWLKRTDHEVSAEFSHPVLQPTPIVVTWDEQRVAAAQLNRGNHLKYPLQMKAARVISEGVGAIMPEVKMGLYTPEEVQDFDRPAQPRRVEATETTPTTEESGEVSPVATPEQVREMKNLLCIVRLPEGTTAKWMGKAGVELWEEMPADVMAKCIEYVKARLPGLAADDQTPPATTLKHADNPGGENAPGSTIGAPATIDAGAQEDDEALALSLGQEWENVYPILKDAAREFIGLSKNADLQLLISKTLGTNPSKSSTDDRVRLYKEIRSRTINPKLGWQPNGVDAALATA